MLNVGDTVRYIGNSPILRNAVGTITYLSRDINFCNVDFPGLGEHTVRCRNLAHISSRPAPSPITNPTNIQEGDWVTVTEVGHEVDIGEICYVYNIGSLTGESPSCEVMTKGGNFYWVNVSSLTVVDKSVVSQLYVVGDSKGEDFVGQFVTQSLNLIQVRVTNPLASNFRADSSYVFSNERVIPSRSPHHIRVIRGKIANEGKQKKKLSEYAISVATVTNFLSSGGELEGQHRIGVDGTQTIKMDNRNVLFCVIFEDGHVLWSSYGACHRDLKDMKSYDKSPAKMIVSSIQCEDLSDEQQGYYDWLFNDSPWKDVFAVNKVQSAFKSGIQIKCDKSPNLVASAAMATRYGQENDGAMAKMWASLCYAGFEHDEAFILCHLFTRNGFGRYAVRRPHSHDVISMGDECIHNFLHNTPIEKHMKGTYSEYKSYDVVSELWGSSECTLEMPLATGVMNKEILSKLGRMVLDRINPNRMALESILKGSV